MEHGQENAEAREILRFLLVALLRESTELECIRVVFSSEQNDL